MHMHVSFSSSHENADFTATSMKTDQRIRLQSKIIQNSNIQAS